MDSHPKDENIQNLQPVLSRLAQYAIPDSRFHYDFTNFVPDFHGSSIAVNRIKDLSYYKEASTIFVGPDNSLQELRWHALKVGKRLLVATFNLRRGFVLLDPRKIPEDKYALASCLDSMELPGIGRPLTLSQLQDEGIKLDMFVIGSQAVSVRGVRMGAYGVANNMSWVILADRNLLDINTPVLTMVHGCQVVDAETKVIEDIHRTKWDYLQCDLIVTPENLIDIKDAKKPDVNGTWFDTCSNELIEAMLPLQELTGIKMMEKIMRSADSMQEEENIKSNTLTTEEKMAMDMVERIMKGYKV